MSAIAMTSPVVARAGASASAPKAAGRTAARVSSVRGSALAGARVVSAPRLATSTTRASVAVRAECGSHAPLVGAAAPDFSAQAVFDQEFMDITLSQYKVLYCPR